MKTKILLFAVCMMAVVGHSQVGNYNYSFTGSYNYETSLPSVYTYSNQGYSIGGNPSSTNTISTDGSTEVGGFNRDTVRSGLALSTSYFDYLEAKISYYDGSFGGWRNIKATVDLEGQTTKLQIDGEVILRESDKPLSGIPIPVGGMTGVYVQVTGYRTGHPMVHGAASLALVDESHPITVVLRPLDTIKYIPYEDVPSGVIDPNDLRITSVDGSWVGYYVDFGWFKGFYFYVDPTSDPLLLWVTSQSTGHHYESFELDPFLDPELKPVAATNFDLIGEVLPFVLTKGRTYASHGSVIDGWTRTDVKASGQTSLVVPAKSFIYEDEKGMNISFYVHGQVSTDAVVRLSAYENNMLVYSTTVTPTDSDSPSITEVLSIGGDGNYKTVMFVIEVLAGTAPDRFYFHLWKGSGGGKG